MRVALGAFSRVVGLCGWESFCYLAIVGGKVRGMKELSPGILEEIERMKRSKFYKLRKMGTHGRSAVRRFHVPVYPSYREVKTTGEVVGIQLPKGSLFGSLDAFQNESGDFESAALWFLAPEDEIQETKYFVVSLNDQVVTPDDGYNLVWKASKSTPNQLTMVHVFESQRNDPRPDR